MPNRWLGERAVAYSTDNFLLRHRLFISLAFASVANQQCGAGTLNLNSAPTGLLFKHFSHFFRALSELFLKFAHQLVILAFCVSEIVIGQLSVFLLKLTLDFIPGAFELEFVHICISEVGEHSVLSLSALRQDSTEPRRRVISLD
jgi:hypothetical protein